MDRWKYFHWCVSRGAGGRSKNPHRFRSNSSSTHPRQWTDFCVGFSFRCDATIRRCSRPRYAVFEEHVFCRLRYLPVTIYCNEREKTRRYSRLRGMSKFVMRELRGSSTMGVRRFTLVAMTPDDRFRRYHGARFISIQYGRGGWMEKKFRVSFFVTYCLIVGLHRFGTTDEVPGAIVPPRDSVTNLGVSQDMCVHVKGGRERRLDSLGTRDLYRILVVPW